MSSIASLSSTEVIRRLRDHGFVRVSQRGSHVKLVKGQRVVIVPHPRDDVRTGTMAAILSQAGMTRAEFDRAS